MRRPPSLTLRVTLLFGITAAIVFAGFGWLIERSIDQHFSSEDTDELVVIADAVSQALMPVTSVDDLAALEQRFSDILLGHHSAVLYVTGQDGQAIFTSPGGPDLSTTTTSAIHNNKNGVAYRWSDTEHTYRVLTRRLGDNASTQHRFYTMSVAVAIDYHLRFLEGFHRTLWIMITSGILVTGLMGWVAVRQGHAPLHNIIEQIRHISASELNTRISPTTVPRELTDLPVSFNEMLERMEESFQRLSNFSADIAHELRTPMTNLLTQTQVALTQTRSLDEYREILYSNMEEYERMSELICDMLFLAKADNGLYQPDSVDVNLTEEIKKLFEYYEAWAEENGITLELLGNVTVPGDKLMLRRAIGNLLSNAIKHTPQENKVWVKLGHASADAISIIVENPGQTIPSEHIPRLFDRFYRVDASRQRGNDGAGLGLAIAKSIVDLHNGNIDVTSDERSTQFRITLPQSTAIPD